jgi:hypothetical protein
MNQPDAGTADGDDPTGSATTAPVVVVGDADRAPDPSSGDDAYADGYAAGTAGRQYDDSAYDEAVKVRYQSGFDAGAAAHRLDAAPESGGGLGEVAGGIAELLGPEVVGHLLHLGPWSTLVALATSPGGDTPLPPPAVLLPLCHRAGHGLGGDAVLDGGAWHGTATLSYADAQAEGAEHASTWDHVGAVHTWSWRQDSWDPID